METSPPIIEFAPTNNWLFNETSPPIESLKFIETSPPDVIRIRSTALFADKSPAGAVKNIKSLFDESAFGDEATILVFWATLITPPSDPHELPGP